MIRLGGPHAHFPYESGLVADHLVQRGDFEGALSSVETALGWANSVYDASSLVSTRSAILQYLGQPPRAVEVAEQSVSMFPDPRLADAMWGYVGLQACQRHLAAGNWNRVAELYDRCAGLDVEDFDVATWLACRRAQFACARGDLDNAEALEELAIARMPDPVAAHLTHRLPVQQTRAEVAAARGRLDEALGHLDPLLDEPALPWFAAMWPAVLAAARIAADRGDPQSEQLSRIRQAASVFLSKGHSSPPVVSRPRQTSLEPSTVTTSPHGNESRPHGETSAMSPISGGPVCAWRPPASRPVTRRPPANRWPRPGRSPDASEPLPSRTPWSTSPGAHT